jgi:hypothetical protein
MGKPGGYLLTFILLLSSAGPAFGTEAQLFAFGACLTDVFGPRLPPTTAPLESLSRAEQRQVFIKALNNLIGDLLPQQLSSRNQDFAWPPSSKNDSGLFSNLGFTQTTRLKLETLVSLWRQTHSELGLEDRQFIRLLDAGGGQNRGVYRGMTSMGPAIEKVLHDDLEFYSASAVRQFLVHLRNVLFAEELGGPRVYAFGFLHSHEKDRSGVFILQEELYPAEGFWSLKALADGEKMLDVLRLPGNGHFHRDLAKILVRALENGYLLSDLDVAFGKSGGFRLIDPGLWDRMDEIVSPTALEGAIVNCLEDALSFAFRLERQFPTNAREVAHEFIETFVSDAQSLLPAATKKQITDALQNDLVRTSKIKIPGISNPPLLQRLQYIGVSTQTLGNLLHLDL